MRYYLTFLTLVALTPTSILRADEPIVGRLRETGVQTVFERIGDDGTAMPPTGIVIPADWKWTDQAVVLVREWISTTDKSLTVYLAGPRVSEHKKIESLKDDFSRLSVKRRPAAFLGITCIDDLVACQVRRVYPGTPAESAGLKMGDTIVGVNETKVDNCKLLQDAMLEFVPDDSVEIHVKRGLEDVTMHVTLSAFPLPPEGGASSDAPESASRSDSRIEDQPRRPGDR